MFVECCAIFHYKAQAETVLDQLGISMATAMEFYFRPISFQRGIPFEMKYSTQRTNARSRYFPCVLLWAHYRRNVG
ncbi:MAG: hypothetical protein DBX65_07295 [Oscillospiraceae bacterium]|nr:MAG: hypothetical protein DBX65_07295 [Oscillospiraceae bacterium]